MKKLKLIAAMGLVMSSLMGQESITMNGATKVYSLDGKWELTGYSPDRSEKISLDAMVPGQVHTDLLREEIIPDPFWRDNAEQCQWPEHWEWRYKKVFDLPEGFMQDWMTLQFDGLDTYADIYINGKKVGTPTVLSSQDMFLPFELDVSLDYLKPRGNVIEVRFYPIAKYADYKSKIKPLMGAFEDPYRPYVRRNQSTFGWDWVHRFISAGIWRPARIVSYKNARVDNLFIYTKSLAENEANIHVEVESTIKNDDAETVLITLTAPDGEVVWKKRAKTAETTFDFSLENPQLWWPNGMGKHPIYTLTAGLYDGGQKLLHEKSVTTGIRTVKIEEIVDHGGTGSSFTIMINGTRIYAKGANWVPASPFPATVTDEKYELLLSQYQQAGFTMMRVWGGGIYESETFWQKCSEKGIMVSQDFMLACQNYPVDEPAFAQLLLDEFEANVKRQRNHPSLVFWVGDNELGLGAKPADNWSLKEFHIEQTAPLMAKLDPSRPFRITSPLGIDPATNNSLKSGDSHTSSFYNKKKADYRADIDTMSSGRFMSEYFATGLPPKRSLMKFMTEADLITGEMLEYHTKDNPYHPSGLTLYRRVTSDATSLYGEQEPGSDLWVSQQEYLHYEMIRLGMEANRRRKFYSSGINFWMFNDQWPASGWSLVDYYGGRKAGWYGAAAGSRPVIAASHVEGGEIVWTLTSDLMEPQQVEVKVLAQPTEGGKPRFEKSMEVTVPANAALEVVWLSLEEMKTKLGNDAVLVCEIQYENGYDRSYWTAGLPQNVVYPKNELKVHIKNSGSEGTITIKSENWARVVNLDAEGVDFEDNFFEMLPGEKRTISWKSHLGELSGDIKVSSWNQ
ncbi:MAG: glycoside hydrolase family 2 protein [Bacteroidota bacterium]